MVQKKFIIDWKIAFTLVIVLLSACISQTALFVRATSRQVTFTELGSYPTGVSAFEVTVIDEVAFVTDDYTGFFIINVSDPTNPTLLNHTVISQSYSLFIDGDTAYIGSFATGVTVLDISDLSYPVEIGSFDDGGSSTDIQVVGNLAFVADYEDGLEILNISDPSNITEIGSYNEGQFINSLAVVDEVAFITVYQPDHDSQLVVLNIRDPSNPTPIVHSKEVNGSATLYYKNEIIYLSSWSDGLIILNISDVANPVELANLNSGGVTSGSYFYDELLFLGKYSEGIEVLDISDKQNPEVVGEYDDGGSATNMFVVGDILYVADKNDGLEILQYEIHELSNTMNGFEWLSMISLVFVLFINRKLVAGKKKRK